MTTNSFSAVSAWGARADDPDEIGHRMLRSLDALSSISPIFRSWWVADFAARAMVPVSDGRTRMTEIVVGGVRKDDDDGPEPERGYFVSALNREAATPETVEFYTHAGSSTSLSRFENTAVFGTYFQQAPDPRIVTYPVFKAVILALAPIWEPAYTQAYSTNLSALWLQPRRRFELSWMTYLSAPLAAKIVPPKSVLTEHVPGGGLLLIAAEETFDTANPRHMEGARAIREALAPLNDLEV